MIAPIRKARPATGARTLEHLEAWEDAALKTHGWYTHYVTGGRCHTHGLPEKYGHPDLELVFPLSVDAAHAVLAGAVALIKEGRTFVDGQVADDVLSSGFRVRFVQTTEGGRRVLRVLLPDPVNRLPGEAECDPFYSAQIEGKNAPQGAGGQDG